MRAICIVCLLLCIGCPYAISAQKTGDEEGQKPSLEMRVKELEEKLTRVEVKLDSFTKSMNQKKSTNSSQKKNEGQKNKTKSKYPYLLFPLVLLISLGSYAYYRRHKAKSVRKQHPTSGKEATLDEIKAVDDIKEELSMGIGSEHETGDTKSDVIVRRENATIASNASIDTSQSEIKELSSASSWTILHGSQIGASHIAASLPCQDYSMHKPLTPDWGICVVSDGAGSANHSHLGSKMVCRIAIRETYEFIRCGKYIEQNKLPDTQLWEQAALRIMHIIKRDLNTIAMSHDFDPKELSATCMITVYSPYGLLSTHIGDGRGGYHDKTKGEWLALFSPHKGEEANQTLFVMSAWENLDKLGGVVVPESHVYLGDIDAFCLLSDGMEKATYECSVYNKELGRYEDLNRPSSKIFSQFLQVVRARKNSGETDETIQQMWQDYLREGNKAIANEADDKTMLLAVHNH